MGMMDGVKSQKKRIFMSLFGVLIGGVCVGFMKVAAFGVDPFQVLVSGLNAAIPIDFGMLYVLINALLLLFRLNDFSEIVAVFLPENAGNLAVFPEKAAATGLGLVAVILDSIDQNDVRFDVFLHVS